MTALPSRAKGSGVEPELDRLTYSAYLLTLDPGLALSLAMSVLDASSEEERLDGDLLRRTVEFALQRLRLDSDQPSDGESSIFDIILQSDSAIISSQCLLSMKQNISENPILALDSEPRITFVLHHVLGYGIREAAVMVRMDEKEFRSQLRKAYLQLAFARTASELQPLDAVLESAMA